MKIAFTICSANYLPFAKSLGDSLVKHNPDYVFKIVLLDTYKPDHAFFSPHTIIPIAEMNIGGFAEMNDRYTIFELSCALKPFAVQYFLAVEHSCTVVAYFDADILVFAPFVELNQQLEQHAIVITPHICAPIEEDGLFPKEEIIIQAGIYNAGFFAISRHPETLRFLQWWAMRLHTKSYNDVAKGFFVDQIWLSLVPVFFSGVSVFCDKGYNTAYWNLHERNLKWNGSAYTINDNIPLVFFHFSGYDLAQPQLISKHQSRHQFEDLPQLKPLFQQYADDAAKNGLEQYKLLPSTYGITPVEHIEPVPPPKKNFLARLFK